jgi:hypothetical protein
MPIYLNVIEHIEPLWTFGGCTNSGSSSSSSLSLIKNFALNSGKGAGDREFNMPISVRCLNKFIYILDSGNNRIKVLSKTGQYLTHIKHDGLKESSSTALALYKNEKTKSFSLLSLNWRLKIMSNFKIENADDLAKLLADSASNQIENFSVNNLEEPIALMETYHHQIFIIQDNKKKLYLCSHTGEILCDALDVKLKQECGIKNITAFCGNLLEPRIFIGEGSNLYELDINWLCDNKLDLLINNFNLDRDVKKSANCEPFTYRKYSYHNHQKLLSTSLTSLASTSSIASTSTVQTTQSNNTLTNSSLNKSNASSYLWSYTAIWHDVHTNRILAAKADKTKTVIECFNCSSHLFEYVIESSSNEKPLKKVTSLCTTNDGKVVCVDLVQNFAKMFRFV